MNLPRSTSLVQFTRLPRDDGLLWIDDITLILVRRTQSSAGGVYCSHVLEHLALEDFRAALVNTRRYLKPGGLFRLVVPDLESLSREYIESSDDNAASRFMEGAYPGVRQRRRGVSGMLRGWLGNSAHLWMWDEKGMMRELRDAGFAGIRRASVGDSADRRFSEVEDPGAGSVALASKPRNDLSRLSRAEGADRCRSRSLRVSPSSSRSTCRTRRRRTCSTIASPCGDLHALSWATIRNLTS